MSDALVFTFIFIALGVGYALGKYLSFPLKKNLSFTSFTPNSRYFNGLTFLLKEETDEAIDRFISDMEVNDETLDVHLSLGSMLRRKGEVARAVKVHENLLSHPALSVAKRNIVQFELSNDYIQSGLYDRAEQLLKELVDAGDIEKSLRYSAMESLVDVYQSIQEWLKAIDVADRLTSQKFSASPDSWRVLQAHFSCELAELAQQKKDESECSKWIRNALHYDASSVRATLLQAKLDMQSDITHAAMAALKSIPNQNPDFATEMIPPLHRCYVRLDSEQDFIPELRSYLKQYTDVRTLGLLVDLLIRYEGIERCIQELREYLPKYVEFKAIETICGILHDMDDSTPAFLARFNAVFDSILESESTYMCDNCGFEGQELHWNCPSCHMWSTVVLRHQDGSPVRTL